ncbi:MSHA biogenesis protein MshC [Massilia sp. Dwa41.01b]|uniref:pilus assembly FimT family protein n=1 Tax=unclassified Massilia TaxID=2609279 RepID=UPI0015FEDCFD|nr:MULTISPECIES: MSHA biogenesis protein MshC [unclassified Massilia]QNA88882.1 MSHA biogenesis protein MshC [Massilia sp. Dwa41.01b]QNA99774.1 MSHA biogenesis protein MshC [Massilia sp. Se16.2.3]
MVELIVVLILVGIVGAIAANRFFERSSYDTAAWTEQVRAVLRYGQKVAIARNRQVHVFLTADRIALCQTDVSGAGGTCDAADRVLAPGGGNSDSTATRTACASTTWMCEGRPAGVTMTVPVASFRFDALGRAIGIGNTRAAITITGNGTTNEIGIEPETGYVN